MVVNSALRDTHKYPDANMYQVMLEEPVHNVTQIQLVDGVFENTERVVFLGANTLHVQFEDDADRHIITIAPGLYDNNIRAIVLAVQKRIEKYDMKVTFDNSVNIITFTCTRPFRLLWKSCTNMARILGFLAKDTEYATQHTSTIYFDTCLLYTSPSPRDS